MLINFFTDWMYYSVLMPFILIIGIAFFVISCVAIYLSKTKSKPVFYSSILIAIFSLFIVYQAVPYFYITKFTITNNVNDLETAAKTSLFSAQKVAIYDLAAGTYLAEKNIDEAVKNYDKMLEYLNKATLPEHILVPYITGAELAHLQAKEYDKVKEITEKYQENYTLAVIACILQKDYNSALKYINKLIDKKTTYHYYATRALIYRNLGKDELAKQDYIKAKQLCLEKKCTPAQQKTIKDKYDNYKNYYQNQKY